MTHMVAEIKDFTLVRQADEIIAYRFRFAKCEDFADAMKNLKTIPLAERRPEPDKAWLWEIKATPANFRILDGTFDNFHQCFDYANSQLKLWG